MFRQLIYTLKNRDRLATHPPLPSSLKRQVGVKKRGAKPPLHIVSPFPLVRGRRRNGDELPNINLRGQVNKQP